MVKVVRPGISKLIRRDIDLLMTIAGLAEKYWETGSRVRPTEFVREFETFVFDELDMSREASNASALRSNFTGSKELYIPEIYWPYCREQVLVMERVSGIPISDIKGLKEAGVNLERLAKSGIRVFYTQVFRDNLFHADMHPGNILVDATDPEDASFIALDFGIVASLTPQDLYYISENFMALFNRDYSGWRNCTSTPAGCRTIRECDELEASIRAVGEPSFSRPLNESFIRQRDAETVPGRLPLQTEYPAAVDHAAKDPAEHRRPGPRALSRIGCDGDFEAGTRNHPARKTRYRPGREETCANACRAG